MRIPGADQAIGHLIKWSEKDEWAPYRRHVFAEHFKLIMEPSSGVAFLKLHRGPPGRHFTRPGPERSRSSGICLRCDPPSAIPVLLNRFAAVQLSKCMADRRVG